MLYIMNQNMVHFCIWQVRVVLSHCRLRFKRCVKNSLFQRFVIGILILFLYTTITGTFYVVYIKYEGLYKSYLVSNLARALPRVRDIDCKIFLNPPEKWNDTLQNISERILPEEVFNYGDCTHLKSHGFSIPTTDLEDSFPIAFSILVYTDVPRFTRLLRAVYRPSNVYCIHVDQKSSMDVKSSVLNLTSCFDNVFLPPDPIEVKWGTTGVLEAEMVCLRALWKRKVRWLAFINLTGEEFPLKTNLELVNILHIMAGRNDAWIDPCTLEGPGDWRSSRCTGLTNFGFSERWKNVSEAPYNIHPYKGQVHVVLSRAAVDYVLHNPLAIDLYNWTMKTFIPDELFFSTLNSNHHLGVPGSNPTPRIWTPSIARLKLWQWRDKSTWSYCSRYVRSVCLLTAREMPLLTTSRQLFANKFKSDYNPLGYSCLEQWYFERVLAELKTGKIQLDLRVYHRIFHQHII